MFKYLFVMISVIFINISFAQEWRWERNDELLNPSGIKTLGMNTPFTGDFDGDGDIDLIVGCKGGVVQYYENIGTPDSAIWKMDEDYFSNLELDGSLAPQPSLIDLNSNGMPELYLNFVNNISGIPLGGLFKFINVGTNEDPIWEESEFEIGYNLDTFYYPQFIDYENDGDYDLIFINQNGLLTYFENIGDMHNPEFQINPVIFETYLPEDYDIGFFYNFRLADVCGDEKLEIFSIVSILDTYIAEFSVFINIGSNQIPEWVYQNLLFHSSYFSSISLSNMDSDDDLDIMLGNSMVPLYYIENIGSQDSIYVQDGTPMGPLFIFYGEDICFVDYDNDTDFDLAYISQIYIYPFEIDWRHCWSMTNLGTRVRPFFGRQTFFVMTWIPGEFQIDSGDLTGDGFPEIIVNNEQIRYYINENGGYSGNNFGLIEINEIEFSCYPELVDLNNDGLNDLIIRHEGELIWKCFRNTGTPQEPAWTETPDWIAGIDSNIAVYRGANINSDDRIDLIGVDENWHLQGYINTGTGDEVSFAYDPEIFADWQDYPVRYYDCIDIDGDGDDDVLVDSAGVINLIENMTPLKITEGDDILPQQFTLYQNYPNPFNASTTISFVLANKSEIDLAIYDITGRLVKNIHSGIISPGEHSFIWDGRNNQGKQLSSGVYFYKLQTSSNQDYKNMILLK